MRIKPSILTLLVVIVNGLFVFSESISIGIRLPQRDERVVVDSKLCVVEKRNPINNEFINVFIMKVCFLLGIKEY